MEGELELLAGPFFFLLFDFGVSGDRESEDFRGLIEWLWSMRINWISFVDEGLDI